MSVGQRLIQANYDERDTRCFYNDQAAAGISDQDKTYKSSKKYLLTNKIINNIDSE